MCPAPNWDIRLNTLFSLFDIHSFGLPLSGWQPALCNVLFLENVAHCVTFNLGLMSIDRCTRILPYNVNVEKYLKRVKK